MTNDLIEGKVLIGTNIIATRHRFASLQEGMDFAKSLVEKSTSSGEVIFFELRIGTEIIVMQCSGTDEGFLQAFFNGSEGWYTLLLDETVIEDVDDDIIIPVFDQEEEEEVSKSYFRLIGVEGAWVSKRLTVDRNLVLQGLKDISNYVGTKSWNPSGCWKHLGFM